MPKSSKKKYDQKLLDELESLHNQINNLEFPNTNNNILLEPEKKYKEISDNNSYSIKRKGRKQKGNYSGELEQNNLTKSDNIIEETSKSNVSNISNNIQDTDKTTNQNSQVQMIDDGSNIITMKEFKTKELMHYKKLDNFFNGCTQEETQMMVDIINGNHLVSLRFLDWFVTRYCYLYKLSINVNNPYIKQSDFNINISYKAQLKSFKKKYFDPFRRKKKFFYICEKNNLVLLTTIGQLNFFRWAISYDIIKYTETNYRNIITKLSHVNTYFKKHVVDNNSFSTSDDLVNSSKTSSENTENTETNRTSETTDTNETNNTNDNDTQENISNNLISKTNSKNHKICLKDKKAKYKNPVVSRNILLEL